MNRQVTDTLLMIEPVDFHRNDQTAVNNYYQQSPNTINSQLNALKEFKSLVNRLQEEGVRVNVIRDNPDPPTPDSIFPNNWVSFHENGLVILYPMFAKNRRLERHKGILEQLGSHFDIKETCSLTDWEEKGYFLEGTGSLVLDRQHRLAYAALSDRTHEEVIQNFEKISGYRAIRFHAYQPVGDTRKHIYHTNVMMSVGEGFAAICLDSIDSADERKLVTSSLEETGKEIVPLSEEQISKFAGNMLQISNTSGKKMIVMSSSGFQSLNSSQKKTLGQYGTLLHSPLDTIEKLGGGSARCMIAELFLPNK